MRPLRSNTTTQGRKMSGARALWRANGMAQEQFGKPIIAVVNSFTQFVPGHTHLHEIGQKVKKWIEEMGCFAAEFNTIAIDDGIAMGHEGMLYSLPSRDLIADSVEYMCQAHCVDAMICISNCDKITPGMLMAAMRLNIPTIFVSGGPMEAGRVGDRDYDLIDVMVMGADAEVSDEQLAEIESAACPTCGSCSGMFTANSMNCLSEALGLSLPGNGTVVATHKNRKRLFKQAAQQIVKNTFEYYNNDNEAVLPRSIATKEAFLNAMSLDIAMGGSTNTVLHLLAIAAEAKVDFTMKDIDALSRKIPVLCKVAPNTKQYHIEHVNRAGGVMAIMDEMLRFSLIDGSVKRVDGYTLEEAIKQYCILRPTAPKENLDRYLSAPSGRISTEMGSQECYYSCLDTDRARGCIHNVENAYSADGGLAVLYGNLAMNGSIVKTAGVAAECLVFEGAARVFDSQEAACKGILDGTVVAGDVVVIRYEGPRGGPGMQEMLYPTSYLKSVKLDKQCALLTDGRFSGGTSGLSIGHVSPEAAAGGAIAAVKDGDLIKINIPERSIELIVDQSTINKRLGQIKRKGFRATKRKREVSGALRAYASMVSSADKGAIRIIE